MHFPRMEKLLMQINLSPEDECFLKLLLKLLPLLFICWQSDVFCRALSDVFDAKKRKNSRGEGISRTGMKINLAHPRAACLKAAQSK